MRAMTPAPYYVGPLVRSAAAIAPFALIGVIAVSMPTMQCWLGTPGAPACAAPATAPAPTPPAAPGETTADASGADNSDPTHPGASPPEPAAPAAMAAATGLFDGTFDSVPALPGAPLETADEPPVRTAALPDGQATASAGPAAAETTPDAIPIRVVATVPIRLGYAPEDPASPQAAAITAVEAARQAGGGTAPTSPTPAAAPQGSPVYLRVDADYLNVRAEPALGSARLFVLEAGERVEMRGRDGDWVQIADAENRLGWVNADYLTDPGAAPAPEASAPAHVASGAEVMIVGGAGVNVRSAPSMRGDKLFALAAGQRVTVSDTRRGWLHITDSEGRAGWSYSSYLYAAGDG